jgi:hypothetical protein
MYINKGDLLRDLIYSIIVINILIFLVKIY